MELRSLINFGQSLSVLTGINIHLHEDGGIHASLVVLRQDKGIIRTLYTSADIYSLVELEQRLLNHVPENGRLHINIEGKGVLLKSLPENEKVEDHRLLLKTFFPMIQEDEFVTQVYSGSQRSFFQIARKDILSALKDVCSKHSWISFSLGAFIAAPLLPFLDGSNLVVKNYVIRSENSKVSEVQMVNYQEPSLPSIPFGNEVISPDTLLAYASAWYILLGSAELKYSDWAPLVEAADAYNFGTHLYRAGKWVMVILLSVLLINAILYFALQDTVKGLELQESLVTSRYKKESAYQQQASSLEAAYEKIGWNSNALPIYYADQIAQLIPVEIQLTSLDIGMLDEALLKNERKQVYQASLIRVKGLTENPISLQQMMQSFEKLSWVKEIEDHRYHHDQRQNAGVFEFIIHIK
jgi:hypothetical protein